MKIAILTPKYLPQINGNTTTVNRLVIGLKNKKILTKVIDLSKLKNENHILKIIEKFNPDIVHAFHAYKSGPIALGVAKKLKKPLLVTITGTDVNHDLFNKERKNKVIDVLKYSKKIVVFHKSIKNKLIKNNNRLKNKIIIIKQSVKLERKKFNLRKKLGLNNNDFVFLILAGIRDIKYHFLYINEFKKLNSKYNNIKLIISGPVLDQNFMNNLFNRIKDIDWIYYLEGIPHDKIFYTIKSTDVVMNISISEGGMSNSVLEAMYCGKVVLASNIDGNKSIIKDNFNGLLFNSKNDFIKKAEMLIKNKKLRLRLGKKSKEILKKNFSFKEEIEDYVGVYEVTTNK
ncbi:MAG: glycosyltransferase family 4 protein [Nanoarchaeota archaeon]|nr:glycosyltransferase family 4 protein [Nanoarchaeota archaeon]